MIEELIKMTAWSMIPPKPYGAFHLLFFFIGLAVVTLGAYLLRNTNEKQNRAVLLSVGGFLILSELYKQLFYFYVIGGGSYQWWIFPFQLCSIPMYFCVIAAFLKPGAIRSGIYNFMLAFNLMGGFVSFFEPSGLVHDYWTLTLHAFIWHMALVFIGLYLGFSGRAGKKLSDYKYTVITLFVLAAIAFAFNLIFWKVSGGDINMFFIGPKNSSIIVFKDIAARFGWYVNLPIYLFALCLGAFIFFCPFCLYNKHKNKESVLSAAK